ncbi:MAG: hypothetical protein JNG82_09645 [Opitutaceae bacterium]|nr:hypothetical protein [Opitutaceae bacterium]
MSETFALKPTHKAVRAYYLALAQLANVGAKHESAVRATFDTLLEAAAGPLKWTLVREYPVSRKGAAPLKLDGMLLDAYRIPHGAIEAKDDADDLKAEMLAKLKLGYPSKNTLFWQPRRALLVQDGKVVLDSAIDTKPEQLVAVLERFFAYSRIKWSMHLKAKLRREMFMNYDAKNIRSVYYRPFTERLLYWDEVLVDVPSHQARFFPKPVAHDENRLLCVSDVGYRSPFSALVTRAPVDLHLCASSDGFECFPLYTYDADGGHRRDNVTDWALEQFKAQYPKAKITKKDIFHYVYAVLHHPAYREKYAANLRRELPRIPFAPDFAAFAKAGEKLAALHTGYETQKEFKLKRVEAGKKPDWRVEKMKLSKDKTALIYNDWLTLEGIPAAAHTYRLGNRSALDWIIDQYQVERAKEDADKILSDPNRADDEEYIVRLVGQVVTVSVETMKLVAALPSLGDGKSAAGYTQAEMDAAHHYTIEEEPAGA